LHNLPHSSKHVDVLELMMGRSMLDGQLPSGLLAWAVPLARAGTPSRVAGVAGRVGSVGVSLGRVPTQGAMVGRRALVVVGARLRHGHDTWAVAWVGRR
jgi:hypothetical protein